MGRSKYINTFSTTGDYDAYINSAFPKFPNVAYDEEAEKIKIMRTSPNDHVIFGTLTDTSLAPVIRFNQDQSQRITAHVDSLNNTFYLDSSDLSSVSFPITKLASFIYDNAANIVTLDKIVLDTSSVTTISSAFTGCTALRSLNLSSWDLSSETSNLYETFRYCNSLTDVYITVEATLMKLTNNLSSQGNSYIPGAATIHYNDVQYKWQNNAWTLQS